MAIDLAAGEAHLRQVEWVRQRFVAFFSTDDGAPVQWRESFLLVKDLYQGRRFECAAGAAVWSPAEGTVAFLRDGRVVDYVPVTTQDQTPLAEPIARAA